MTKEKLIAEYQIKVSDCDRQIESLNASIRKARTEKESEDVIADIANERKIEDAKRQAYFQFLKNLEDL